jgi:ATP synthase in type III secretion protein N
MSMFNTHLHNLPIAHLVDALRLAPTCSERGRIVQAFGTTLRASGLRARIGQQCLVHSQGAEPVRAEVVGLSQGEAILMPLSGLQGVSVDALVEIVSGVPCAPYGRSLLGRVLDGNGVPLDGKPLPSGLPTRPLEAADPNPMTRMPISQIFETGVRAIDAGLTVGVGQRVGVFAMAGGGKSTLLGMLARNASCDVNVIALIGERGREVREFIEDCLGPQGLARSVVVVATSARPAMERLRAAQVATAMAEGFRSEGASVMLLMDSATRYARALREIGLSVGEPPVRRGFPPSVFAELPRLLERAGNDDKGSITAFYTVLAEDEDGSDPVAEEVRSILDGHIVLSRELGQAGHYPAIDLLGSASRVFTRIASPEHQARALRLRALMARHKEVRFLLQVGEYKAGSDALADEAIARWPRIESLLRQVPESRSSLDETLARLTLD